MSTNLEYRGIRNKTPPLRSEKSQIFRKSGGGFLFFLKICSKKWRGVFIFLQIPNFWLIFLTTKKTPNFSVSPLRNPLLVPKTPQNFRRRFAPIWTSENLSSKKVEGGFIFSQILQKSKRGGFNRGGLFLIPRYIFFRSLHKKHLQMN